MVSRDVEIAAFVDAFRVSAQGLGDGKAIKWRAESQIKSLVSYVSCDFCMDTRAIS